MSLADHDILDLIALRHELHRFPEISGQERDTAARIRAALAEAGPDQIFGDLGGHGLAAVFCGTSDGPTVLFRCELDALPIQETGPAPYRSERPGTAHLCGHDGHMAILTGLARCLARQRPERGRAVLLFQPAEETGAGAAAVMADPKFAAIRPDHAFALHNNPGAPLGHVALSAGPVTCASRGLEISLAGMAAHASQPETGCSPTLALAALLPALSGLSHGETRDTDFTLVTITHATMGEPTFGIAPGDARIFATLRTLTDDGMEALCARALTLITQVAAEHNLRMQYSYRDIFRHSANDPTATSIVASALDALGLPHDESGLPWRPSEDFGRFSDVAASALLFLGAGRDQPPLHNPHYDFPDDLIATGARIFERIARDLLG